MDLNTAMMAFVQPVLDIGLKAAAALVGLTATFAALGLTGRSARRFRRRRRRS